MLENSIPQRPDSSSITDIGMLVKNSALIQAQLCNHILSCYVRVLCYTSTLTNPRRGRQTLNIPSSLPQPRLERTEMYEREQRDQEVSPDGM